MPIKSSLFFSYAGRLSSDFGITNVNISSGLMEEYFLPTASIKEQVIPGRTEPYFISRELEPIEIELTCFFDNGINEYGLRQVARWLSQEYYQPLWFSENPDRIFYAVYISDPRLIHNGMQGYFTIRFRCSSPYAYSPYHTSEIISSGTYEFKNLGDVNLYPEIWIYKVGIGDFSITNVSNKGEITSFSDLADSEVVFLDCGTGDIISDIPDMYRYVNYNNVPLELIIGKNILEIVGGNVQFGFRYRYLQG